MIEELGRISQGDRFLYECKDAYCRFFLFSLHGAVSDFGMEKQKRKTFSIHSIYNIYSSFAHGYSYQYKYRYEPRNE